MQETDRSEGVTKLCEDKETEGFDLQAGTTWIYPTNYPCRDYQYAIIQEALLKNTMVSLPTGLGKTFIAAVVMYNFYRWYPKGKIVFMAPTRPLVKQQIDACYKIMAIPKEVTAELTGTKLQESRKNIWNEKRVFFITPQVLQNDLNILVDFGSKIKCLVIDEAHKAKGNHAYCEVIRKLKVQNKYFRVLALSATPGNTVRDIMEVIDNLLITHLEIRTDDSPDVVPYIFERSLETVVVPLDDMLQKVRDDYIQLLEKYTRVLMQHKVLTGNCSMLSKGKIFMTMKSYQEQNRQTRDRNYSEIMRYLNISHTLYYAFELLIRHGLRSFLLFFRDRTDKSVLHDNILQDIIHDIEEYMGPLFSIEALPDGSITGIPDTVKFGHPKFYKLRDVTYDHFKQQNNNETRVIIFCEYRETVMEAYGILSLSQPLIKPRIFMGKSSITQKQQISVVKAFREGTCNTLISTCIGEEGLDVGNVDLIICFDINNKSPIRMIQRMGRTGRKREGRVVILVTEGKEQQTLKECLIQKHNLSNHILYYKSFENQMYQENPRMIPENIEPQCNKIFITVKQESSQKVSKNKGKNLKEMFQTITKKTEQSSDNNEAKLTDIIDITDKLPAAEFFWNSGKEVLFSKTNVTNVIFANRIDKLRILQPTSIIGHSSKTKMMTSLLEKCESVKFNLPITQNPILISQKPQNKSECATLANSLKQGDIRNMFVKPYSLSEEVSDVNTATTTDHVLPIHDDKKEPIPDKNLSGLTIDSNNLISNCKLCANFFDCSQYYSTFTLNFSISELTPPDTSILNKIDYNSLISFEKALTESTTNALEIDEEDVDVMKNNGVTAEKHKDETPEEFLNSPFKPPKSITNVLEKCNMLNSTFPKIEITQLELESAKNNKNVEKNFGLNATKCNTSILTRAVDPKTEKNANADFGDKLSFFNISALEDIFDDSFNDQLHDLSQNTIIYTPPEKCQQETVNENVDSPILSTFIQTRYFNTSLSPANIQARSTPNLRKLLNPNVKTNNHTSPTDIDIVDSSIISPILSNKSHVHFGSKGEEKLIHSEIKKLNFSNIPSETFKLSNDNTIRPDKNGAALPNNKEDLLDFYDNSILEIFYDDNPFQDVPKNANNKNVKCSTTQPLIQTSKQILQFQGANDNIEEKISKSSIIPSNSSLNADKNNGWENDIWDFCKDSDEESEKSTHEKEKEEAIHSCLDDSKSKSEVDNTTASDEEVIIVSDNSSGSSTKSPSLMRSQRIPSQSSDRATQPNLALKNTMERKSKKTNILKLKRASWVTQMYDANECDDFIVMGNKTKAFAVNESSNNEFTAEPHVSVQLSPTLNKSQITINKEFNVNKVTKKLIFSDDDDDFELPPKPTPAWIFPKSKKINSKELNTQSPSPKKQKIGKRRLDDCQYVELEAEASGTKSDIDDISEEDGSFEKSFVDDNPGSVADTTMMHVEYLKSVRTVDINRGVFKIPQPPVINTNVYSQVDVINEHENTYLNDSFCVSSQDTGICNNTMDMSELEIAELILEQERKKKNSRTKSQGQGKSKRRRIIDISSDSD